MTTAGWFSSLQTLLIIATYANPVTLSKFPDIEVEIFESAQQLAELGAGIGLFPRMSSEVCSFVKIVIEYEIGPWEIVKKLGLEEDLLKTTEIKITDGPGAFL